MALIEDVNNKPGMHKAKNDYWASVGEKVVRCKLPYGDYVKTPPVVVDTKADIYELAQNIQNDHERFRNAAIKARDCGSLLVILVENDEGVTDLDALAAWDEPKRHHYDRCQAARRELHPVTGSRLAKACRTMEDKYGLKFEFCTPSDAGARVLQILEGAEDGGKGGGM